MRRHTSLASLLILVAAAASTMAAACLPPPRLAAKEAATAAATPTPTVTATPTPTVAAEPSPEAAHGVGPSATATTRPVRPTATLPPAPPTEEPECAWCKREPEPYTPAPAGKQQPPSHADRTACLSCHKTLPDPTLPTTHSSLADGTCAMCHVAPPKVRMPFWSGKALLVRVHRPA